MIVMGNRCGACCCLRGGRLPPEDFCQSFGAQPSGAPPQARSRQWARRTKGSRSTSRVNLSDKTRRQ